MTAPVGWFPGDPLPPGPVDRWWDEGGEAVDEVESSSEESNAMWGENEIVIGETSTGGLTVVRAPEVVWVRESLLREPDLDAGRLEVREGEFVMHADNGDWTYRHIGNGPEPGVLAFGFVCAERTVVGVTSMDGVTFEVIPVREGPRVASGG